MRLTISCVLISLFSMAMAQTALPIADAASRGINIASLDRQFTMGIGSDSVETVFKGKETEYINAYYAMMRQLGEHLNQNSFRWGGSIRCFNRIYFNADGSIAYYLYEFEDPISDSKKARFQELLSSFISTYRFTLPTDQRFAQCSPVNYRDIL